MPEAGRRRPASAALGVRLDPLGMEEAVATCLDWARAGGPPRLVVPLNAALIAAARRDPALRTAIGHADLAVADGVPVLWAARLAGEPLGGRVAGIDLMQRLLAAAAAERLPVYLLGARPHVVAALAAAVEARHPGLVVAGFQHGYFTAAEEAGLITRIRASGARLLFVGMPSPFKEVWPDANRAALGVPVTVAVGGSFDVLAGFVPRAPGWMQRSGLEWSWRLLREPRRLWRRYLIGNSRFLLIAAGAALRHRLRIGGRRR